MSQPSSLLCIVGPQPPPRHGVSAINEAVSKMAAGTGLEVRCFNTSPNTVERTLLARLSRLAPLFQAVRRVRAALRQNGAAVVYCSVSGGIGILSEMAIVSVARKQGAKLVLHHHSFRYLDEPYAPMKMLARLAGPNALHVLLGPNMEEALARRYSAVKHTMVVSNAAFFSQTAVHTTVPRLGCRIVGHLSNLSSDKGVMQMVELAEWALREKLDFDFRIAGPFENDAIKDQFWARAKPLQNLRYLGPLYAAEKEQFFEELDVFVFPTQYRNEAEPLVLLEALSRGCPVISYDRGCISCLIDSTCGVLIPREQTFLPGASTALKEWRGNAEIHFNLRRGAREKFGCLIKQAAAAKQKLMNVLAAAG